MLVTVEAGEEGGVLGLQPAGLQDKQGHRAERWNINVLINDSEPLQNYSF